MYISTLWVLVTAVSRPLVVIDDIWRLGVVSGLKAVSESMDVSGAVGVGPCLVLVLA